MLEQIFTGIGAGITLALTGFAKSSGEKFNHIRFGATIILGGIVGLGYGVANIPLDTGMSYATQVGAIILIENILKAIKRRLFG